MPAPTTIRLLCSRCAWTGVGEPPTLAVVRLGPNPDVLVAMSRLGAEQVARDERRARSDGGAYLRQRVDAREMLQPRRRRELQIGTATTVNINGLDAIEDLPPGLVSIKLPTARTDFQSFDAVDTGRRFVTCSRGHRHQVTRSQLIRAAARAASEGAQTATT